MLIEMHEQARIEREAKEAQDSYWNQLEQMIQDLAKELNCSYACAGDVWYLRQRSRWTQELEDELILLYAEGTPPNVMEFGCTGSCI